jgi:hypothetical protein
MMTKGTALAPSQHIRASKTRTSRTSRTALAAVVLLGASLALSACGAQEAGAAAIVNGSTISDKDLQTASLQLEALTKSEQQAQIPTSVILLNLILAPYVDAEADRVGKGVTNAEVIKAIPKVVNPSPALVDFVRMQLAIPSLTQASKDSILAKLEKAKITVNPRYGTLDLKQATLNPTSPDWIKTSTATATP